MKDDFIETFLTFLFIVTVLTIIIKCCARVVRSCCCSSHDTEGVTIARDLERESEVNNRYIASQPYQALRNPLYDAPLGTNQAVINSSYPATIETTYTPYPMPSQPPYYNPNTQSYLPYPTPPPPYTPFPTNPQQPNTHYSTFTPPPYPHQHPQTHLSHLTNAPSSATYPTTGPPQDLPYPQNMPLPSYDIQRPSAPHPDV